MPAMKREEWLKLDAKGKLLHRMQRLIDRIEQLQANYYSKRASGRIPVPIRWMERD